MQEVMQEAHLADDPLSSLTSVWSSKALGAHGYASGLKALAVQITQE
jgi:hypothetical protein